MAHDGETEAKCSEEEAPQFAEKENGEEDRPGYADRLRSREKSQCSEKGELSVSQGSH